MIGKILTTMIAASLLAGAPEEADLSLQDKVVQEVRQKAVNPFVKGGVYEDMQIEYQGAGKTELLKAEDVVDWVRYWEDGHWDIDDAKIAEYVDHLEDVFNTSKRERLFDTTLGETITIKKGDYGWALDRGEEVHEISKMLRNNSLTEHEIHFAKMGQESEDPMRDYGDSYVEIDLSNQVLWLYEEGRLTLVSNIVSGLMNTERQTPGGIYGITYKQSPAVLRGADYETPVSYWMPFNGGIGLHDATWQSSFGGDACYYRGSHGCINLPLEIAAQIYERVSKGFPVICYYSNPEDGE